MIDKITSGKTIQIASEKFIYLGERSELSINTSM